MSEQTAEGKVAGFGKPVAALPTEIIDPNELGNIAGGAVPPVAGNDHSAEGVIADTPPTEGATGQPPQPQFSDEQLTEFLKSKGIEVSNLDELKNKLSNNQQPSADPTPEEKVAKEQAAEKRLVDHFLSKGGTLEQYMQMKQIANSDLTELSTVDLKTQLKTEGFNDNQIYLLIIKTFSFQLSFKVNGG